MRFQQLKKIIGANIQKTENKRSVSPRIPRTKIERRKEYSKKRLIRNTEDPVVNTRVSDSINISRCFNRVPKVPTRQSLSRSPIQVRRRPIVTSMFHRKEDWSSMRKNTTTTIDNSLPREIQSKKAQRFPWLSLRSNPKIKPKSPYFLNFNVLLKKPLHGPCAYYIDELRAAYYATEPSQLQERFKEHFSATFKILSKSHEYLSSKSDLLKKTIRLSESKLDILRDSLIVLLDIDETLLHSKPLQDLNYEHRPDELLIEVGSREFVVYLRPGVNKFLKSISKLYKIILYTAAQKEYAEKVLNILDPDKNIVFDLFTRENCVRSKGGGFTKDIRILEGVDINSVFFIDNFAGNLINQPDNAIIVLGFEDDFEDCQLKRLRQYLEWLSRRSNPLESNAKYWRLNQIARQSHLSMGYDAILER